LFFAILARQLATVDAVTVYERFPEGVTYGWGVVFWDGLLEDLDASDEPTARQVRAHAFQWRDQVIDVEGRAPVRLPGHGYSMSRRAMRALLTERAREVGADLRFGHAVEDPTELEAYDLVVASDGVNSGFRQRHGPEFGPAVERRRNKYIWLGTSKVFESFTFPFVRTDAGWLWAHAYGYGAEGSTFVVETSPETWTGLGFDSLAPEPTMRELERIFARHLDGRPLKPPAGTHDSTPWLEFQTVSNARWHHGNVALLGDAAHTTHFTIGSGTRLALEDGIALASQLRAHDALGPALAAYSKQRTAELEPVAREAGGSAEWFEDVPRYIERDAQDFARLLISRRRSLVRRLPSVYLGLRRAAAAAPVLSKPARRAVRRLRGSAG
jgi:anthraniloyl-CoA monooxygenase